MIRFLAVPLILTTCTSPLLAQKDVLVKAPTRLGWEFACRGFGKEAGKIKAGFAPPRQAESPLRQAELNVMVSGAFTAAYDKLAPQFERATGSKVVPVYGASMGSAPDAIPNRLRRGEPADVVILAADALDDLIKKGKVLPGSRVDLARSSIGMVVKKGACKPDISSVEALKRTLREAKSIAYSDSASGTYLAEELFPRLGIAEEIGARSKRIVKERVAAVVARGDAEIGFQQISELLPVSGVVVVGPLPGDAQKVTVFSAGVASGAREPEAARALIRFLASPKAAPVIEKTGLEPVTK